MDRYTPFVIAGVLAFGSVAVLRTCSPSYREVVDKPAVSITVNHTKAPYQWKVIRVLDGDTVEVDAKFFPEELGNIRVRIEGIDTPESGGRAKCDDERDRAKVAKKFAKDTLEGKVIEVRQVKTDKYGGRIVGDIYIDGKPYRQLLLEKGLAKSYDGGTKSSWCRL